MSTDDTRKPVEGTSDVSPPEPEEDFAALLEASERDEDTRIRRDEKVTGTVISIGEDWVFVDVGAKTEGTISREELLDEEGNLAVGVGDTITAYVVSLKEGEIILSSTMTAVASEEALGDAYRSGIPVEGRVTGERKGGYTVSVFGKEAFCPYSQIDLGGRGSPEDYLEKRFTFRVIEYSERGRNVVLSRREILEEERRQQLEELMQQLQVGDVVEGTVRNITHFGAFVDIGGTEGLIPMAELAWYRVESPSDVVTEGETLKVKILDLDWANDRISLSRKQTLEDPWDSAAKKYIEGSSVTGTVTRLAPFGAFVRLEPGIEGLIHISNLGTGRRIGHPKEVVEEGQTVEARILSVDQENRRIGLELTLAGDDADAVTGQIPVKGDVVEGEVDAVKDYGVFVALPGGVTGLLHVSEIDDGGKSDLRKRFPVGEPVTVEVIEADLDAKRFSLSTKSLRSKAEKSQYDKFRTTGGSEGFGTLGDLLKDKMPK